MEEEIKTGYEKYLDKFDDKYRKYYKNKQKVIPILLNLFEQYEEDIYSPSTLDKEMHRLQLEISNKLQEKCTKEQNELIDQLIYCIGAENGELVEKTFIFGYQVGKSLKDEADTFIKK